MSDKPVLSVKKLEGGGISADGREAFLDLQMDDRSFRLAFNSLEVRQAAVMLLGCADAAQSVSGMSHLSNFTQAVSAEAGAISGQGELFALTLSLAGEEKLTFSLPMAVAQSLSAVLQRLAPEPSDPPPRNGSTARH